ncbi:MAG: hypothetical protein NVSMB4_00530 [Acidimicrobiales bacterium]
MSPRPVFVYDGVTHHVGSLKVREVEGLETLLGCRYVEITPLGTMRHKLAMMTVFLGRTRTEAEVEQIITDLNLDQVDDMWDVVDDDLPDSYEDGIPNLEGGPSTPMS